MKKKKSKRKTKLCTRYLLEQQVTATVEPAVFGKSRVDDDDDDNGVILLTDRQQTEMAAAVIEKTYKVLIPINDQDSALYALESAMARRWPAGTQFMLITVVEDLTEGSPAGELVHRMILQAEQEEYRQSMEAWLTRLKDTFSLTFPNTGATLESGRIAERICQCASTWGADYILIGSHELTAATRIALGSIASQVLMRAPCPVEAIRFRNLKDMFSSGKEVTPELIRELASQAPQRIIVASNLADQSNLAVDWIADSSLLDQTKIRLVAVTEATKRDTVGTIISRTKNYFTEHRHQRIIEERLRAMGKRIIARHPHCKLEVIVLQSDSVSDAILELASSWGADLVVGGMECDYQSTETDIGISAVNIMDRLECSAIAIKPSNGEPLHFSWYAGLQQSLS